MTVKDMQPVEGRAQAIHDQYGARGTIVIAEKVSAAAAAQDEAGVANWLSVASAFVNLYSHSQQTQWDIARHMRQLLDAVH